MKILGGQLRGRNFYMPAGIRPTQSIARKALFDILGHDLSGITFVDLFAGSGAVGLEAISRGASQVIFVEKDSKCGAVINENIALLGLEKGGAKDPLFEVIQTDAYAAIKHFFRLKRHFDVVFVDPPYGRGLAKKALKTLGGYDILQPNCAVVIQHENKEILPEQQGRFSLFGRKKYGGTTFSIYKAEA